MKRCSFGMPSLYIYVYSIYERIRIYVCTFVEIFASLVPEQLDEIYSYSVF
jgi:hypothetical protein